MNFPSSSQQEKTQQGADNGTKKSAEEPTAPTSGAAEKQQDGGLNELDFQDRNGQHHPIAEFLYQLTKMLTDDNSEIIEWADGRIKVHYPERLEGEVLHKYFRHSKFASFQRQLNYFGFRKIAGKGKMSPCSYVNEAATSDIRSLLLIKRKTNGSAARKAAMQQRAAAAAAMSTQMNPALLAGMNLSALAAAGGNGQGLGNLSGNALSNAIALLSENALRAGIPGLGNQQNSISQTQLSLLALQQQQQQLQQQLQQQKAQLAQATSNEQLQQLAQQHLGAQQSFLQQQQAQLAGMPAPGPAALKSSAQRTPSLEQLHAQLAANLASTQQQQQQSQLPGLQGFPGLASGAATAALNKAAAQSSNPATAALQAQNSSMPATAAMDAAATSQTTNNLFESAINLKSLLQEHQQNLEAASRNNNGNNGGSNQQLLNRLPSSNQIFPENMSTVSFGNLLGSSNRLNSLLSLSSFSREQSLADFAAFNNLSAQLQAAGHPGAAAQMQQAQGRNQS